MLSSVRDFLRERFVLPRYSEVVVAVSGGYRHIAKPSFCLPEPLPAGVLRRLPDGNIESGVFTGMVNDCLGEYLFPTAERHWDAFADWYVGNFEEVSERIARQDHRRAGFYAFSNSESTAARGERVRVSVRCLVVWPIGHNQAAEVQTAAFPIILGFLREAADYADAVMSGIMDLPNLTKSLTGDGVVLNEAAGLAFRLEFPLAYKTTKRYELQV